MINRASHRATKQSPFEVVYGFNPNTALDILPLPLHERTDMDFDKRADYMKTLHESTRATLEEHTNRQAAKINKLKKPMIFEEGDLVWLHLRKDRFPDERKSKLAPRGDGPFKVLKRINDNAYKSVIPTSKYLVHDTFNISDLSPFHGYPSAQDDDESRTTLSEGGGGDDVAPHMDNTTNGPMTRSRVKALHEKVTSLLSMCDLDTPLNGLLLHSGTLCILRIHLDDDPQWGRKDEQEKV